MKRETGRTWMPIWIDWLLLLLLVGGTVFGYRFLRSRYRDSLPNTEITYTVRLSEVDGRFARERGGWEYFIPTGTAVRNANDTAVLGYVTAVEAIPSVCPSVRDGAVIFLEIPERYDLYITVKGKGIAKTGDGIRIQDIRIATGCVGDWRFGTLLGSKGVIVSVNEEN